MVGQDRAAAGVDSEAPRTVIQRRSRGNARRQAINKGLKSHGIPDAEADVGHCLCSASRPRDAGGGTDQRDGATASDLSAEDVAGPERSGLPTTSCAQRYAAAVAAGPDVAAMRLRGPLPLSRSTLDTATERRTDEAWLAAAVAEARTRFLVVDDGRIPVTVDRHSLRLLGVAELDRPPTRSDIFLGVDADGATYFAVNAADGQAMPVGPTATLREVGTLLGARDAGMATRAIALTNWHGTHRRCPRCGNPTEVAAAGHLRVCPRDGSEHFPRTDPAIIVLVVDDHDRCLLGRQATWPPGRFSTLAGFVEPGESLEQAVLREVFEEVGIHLAEPTYAGSQAWPFPASLMIGFFARATTTTITVDGTEIAEAGWYSRAVLDARLAAGEMLTPSGISIARRLIEGWYGGPIGDEAST